MLSQIARGAAGLTQDIAHRWRLSRYPGEWRNDLWLARWRERHERHGGDVWVLWPGDGYWELYAPGTIQGVMTYGNPYVEITRSGIIYPDGGGQPDLPMSWAQRQHIEQEVARLTNGHVVDLIEGLRPLNAQWTIAAPTVYLRVRH